MKCADSQVYWNNKLPVQDFSLYNIGGYQIVIYNSSGSTFAEICPLQLYINQKYFTTIFKEDIDSHIFSWPAVVISIPEEYHNKSAKYSLKDRRGQLLFEDNVTVMSIG